jgi:polysaccharide export outer membrane protein
VTNSRPFYVSGEVAKPGEYPYAPGLTILNLVAMASGFTDRADIRHVFVKHVNESAEREYALTSAIHLLAGDTIRIGDRFGAIGAMAAPGRGQPRPRRQMGRRDLDARR